MSKYSPLFLLPLLLLFLVLSWTLDAEAITLESLTLPTTTPSTPVSVTLYLYEDTNLNGWRDANELPYLPDSLYAAICISFESWSCGHFKTVPLCLVDGYANTLNLPADCRLSVYRVHLRDAPNYTDYIGDFPLASAPATLYFPTSGSFVNAIGTPTPTSTPQPVYLPSIAS